MRASEFLREATPRDQIAQPGSEDFEASKDYMKRLIKAGIDKYNRYLTTIKTSNAKVYNALIADPNQLIKGITTSITSVLINNGAGNITDADVGNLTSVLNLSLPSSGETAEPQPANTNPPDTPKPDTSTDDTAPSPASSEKVPQPSPELQQKAANAVKGVGPKLTQEEWKFYNKYLDSQGMPPLGADVAEPADSDKLPPTINDGEVVQLSKDEKYTYSGGNWYEVKGNRTSRTPASATVAKMLTKVATKKNESIYEGVAAWNPDIPSIQLTDEDIDNLAQAATEVWYYNRYLKATGNQNIAAQGGQKQQQSSQQSTDSGDPLLNALGYVFKVDPNDKTNLALAMIASLENPEQAKRDAAKLRRALGR